MRLALWTAAAGLFAATFVSAADDATLRAMRDELNRSRGLKVLTQDTPYYIEYTIEDANSFEVSATLGGLVSVRPNRFRLPEIHVRVGDYKFDNTDYVGSGHHFGTHYDVDRFPVETSYDVLRRYLWLATDGAYKSAVEALARKRAALKNVTEGETLDDFAKAPPLKKILDLPHLTIDQDAWSARVRSLSSIFEAYPAVKGSMVELDAVEGATYYVNSEGSEVRTPDNAIFLMARADAQSADGMIVRDSSVFHATDLRHLAAEPEIRRSVTALAEGVTALAAAPKGDDYSGPVLFQGMASSQLFAQVLGHNLSLTRRPVMEPGHPGSLPASELEGRQGVRILPEFFDVVDDPTQKEWQGRPLLGSYEADREGVAPVPLSLVEKGVLKAFLMTRQPMTGFSGSNGRARLPGNFGANEAAMSNLFVRATETSSVADLKKKLIAMCVQRHKPYGMIVRKMDFPSNGTFEEVRKLLSGTQQSGGHAVSPPLLLYRVYPDGHEELVRGMQFRSLNARSLKDILAAGDDNNAFDFLDSPAPFALIGASSYVAPTTVVAPSVLIDDVDLHVSGDELPKLPIVPPPDMHATVTR